MPIFECRRGAIATLERPADGAKARILSPMGHNRKIRAKCLRIEIAKKLGFLWEFSLVGAAGFEPATTRTPSVTSRFYW
jgi:hypothetical protein